MFKSHLPHYISSDGWLKSVNLYLGFCRAGDITVSNGKANINFTETGMPHVAYFYQGGGSDAAFPGYGALSIYDPVFEELLKTRTPRMFLEDTVANALEYEADFGITTDEYIDYALKDIISKGIIGQFDSIKELINGTFDNTDNYVYEFVNNTTLPADYDDVCLKEIIKIQHNLEEHHLKPQEAVAEPADGHLGN